MDSDKLKEYYGYTITYGQGKLFARCGGDSCKRYIEFKMDDRAEKDLLDMLWRDHWYMVAGLLKCPSCQHKHCGLAIRTQ